MNTPWIGSKSGSKSEAKNCARRLVVVAFSTATVPFVCHKPILHPALAVYSLGTWSFFVTYKVQWVASLVSHVFGGFP